MVTLYVDEDFSYPVVQRLRQLGHDVLTAQEAGQASQGITDEAALVQVHKNGNKLLKLFERLPRRENYHSSLCRRLRR